MSQVYVPGMRSKALVHLMRNAAPMFVTSDGQRKRATQLPLASYARLMRFDSTGQAKEFVLLHQVGSSLGGGGGGGGGGGAANGGWAVGEAEGKAWQQGRQGLVSWE